MSLTPKRERLVGGFIASYVVIAGIILLFTFIAVYQLIIQRYFGVNVMKRSHALRFLGEAGIGFTAQKVRLALKRSPANPLPDLLKDMLTGGTSFKGSIKPYLDKLDNQWEYDLASMARAVAPNATVVVEGSFQDFKLSETDTGAWADPTAMNGLLFLQATAKIGTASQIICSYRPIWVGNILPPVSTKFTLRVHRFFDSSTAGQFNVASNTYNGDLLAGPQPLFLFNHALPDDPFSAKTAASILEDNKRADIFKTRGWIWIRGPANLQICSGANPNGEMFLFYKTDLVASPAEFSPVNFVSPQDKLPLHAAFSPGGCDLPWDAADATSTSHYQFKQMFYLDGFHDVSKNKQTQAMYEGNIFSVAERAKYKTTSSVLRLFGKSLSGFQSPTKVFGDVNALFPCYSMIDPNPTAPGAAFDMFKTASDSGHPFTYFLYGLDSAAFSISRLKEFGDNPCPYVLLFDLFDRAFEKYQTFMSQIYSLAYAELYNMMWEVTNLDDKSRSFPPKGPSGSNALHRDTGSGFELRKGADTVLYNGALDTPNSLKVVEKRVQMEVKTIQEFWDKFYDTQKKVLSLDSVVRILNTTGETLKIPRENETVLDVETGGLIVLEQGNVEIKSVQLKTDNEALTIVAPNAATVTIIKVASQALQLNLVAPLAELKSSGYFSWYGSLELADLKPENNPSGGEIRFRESQDPTQDKYQNFYRGILGNVDKSWND